MITRIYRVRIKSELRAEFEPLFRTVARQSVENYSACNNVTLGYPTIGAPDEYAMITEWTTTNGLTEFAGDDWSIAHIPQGMERFIDQCWVHHYENN